MRRVSYAVEYSLSAVHYLHCGCAQVCRRPFGLVAKGKVTAGWRGVVMDIGSKILPPPSEKMIRTAYFHHGQNTSNPVYSNEDAVLGPGGHPGYRCK
ncbi:hypothetical protein EYF80_011137 [Liparis tanakae]|uniref:Uncharacterized protein n=1 Tax=Liparis tanakae TaxID=230148 RepID=A0A4Z2IMU9_9TELE|nr:hypothetical protein EYF80_011137 [Liparis tanakae]